LCWQFVGAVDLATEIPDKTLKIGPFWTILAPPAIGMDLAVGGPAYSGRGTV
jgi:hypothetical protein